ncbi:MAG: hypothetical protein JO317_07355, partial [Verrucomicrobiae bacterium]|nr:hypothetical protein [Verrucomicrobiae bacterium]
AVHMATDSTLFAPSAQTGFNAGAWNLSFLGSASAQDQFVNATGVGQIYLDAGAVIDVGGSADISAPISENIVAVQLHGAELADSPLQRFSALRGETIFVDLRQSGTYQGREWIGTPLADASGYIGLIQRSVGELTTGGGSVRFNAGESVVMQPGSLVNVAGGWIDYQSGKIETSQLVSGGHVFDISQATPDQVYQFAQAGSSFTADHLKWGVSETFNHAPLIATAAHFEDGYVQGGAGGSFAIIAPAVALDGNMTGATVTGPRQRSAPPAGSSWSLAFLAQDPRPPLFLPTSPTPPRVFIRPDASHAPADSFALDASGNAVALRADRRQFVTISPELLNADGFGSLAIENSDGDITMPAGVSMSAAPGGSIRLSAANLDVEGRLSAPGGSIVLSALDFSPYAVAPLLATPGAQTPPPDPSRGHFSLGSEASLSTAGLVVDDRPGSANQGTQPLITRGGSIAIKSHSADLAEGSSVDASGGVAVAANGKKSYGAGGSIDIEAGQDPNLPSILGGQLHLDASLRAYSGGRGGSLTVLAPAIQIGGSSAGGDTLILEPGFFNQGGFNSFNLKGIGSAAGQAGEFVPGIFIAPGTAIAPSAQSWVAALGDDGVTLSTVLNPAGVRSPASVSFTALGSRDSLRTDPLVVRGDFLMAAGSSIRTDPQGSVAISGDTATVLGEIEAPGGAISVSGGKNSSALFSDQLRPLPTVILGSESSLSAAGTTVLTPDPRGLRTGSVLPGGTVNVSGNIVAQAGSRIDVSGASGVLDLPPGYGGNRVSAGSTSGATFVPTRVESDGGSIVLAGAQELFTEATLAGTAGGSSSSSAGRLVVSSGRFYAPDASAGSKTPLDATLIVTQSAHAQPVGPIAIGEPLVDANGDAIPGMGYFAADSFASGDFSSLTLKGTV